MENIDLSKSLEGHVILWAKGWYGESTLERLNEILQEWSGCVGGPHMKYLLTLLSETMEVIQINPRNMFDALVYSAARTNKRSTSYHVNLHDTVDFAQILIAMSNTISSQPIKNSRLNVKLPEILPELQKKYDLVR